MTAFPVHSTPFDELEPRLLDAREQYDVERSKFALYPFKPDQGARDVVKRSYDLFFDDNAIFRGFQTKIGDLEDEAVAMALEAVVGLTKSLALEYGDTGVRCNAVCPGFTDTEMGDRGTAQWASVAGADPTVLRAEAEADVPMGRWATPGDVARAVAWLASPAASYINGVTLPVAGGLVPGL